MSLVTMVLPAAIPAAVLVGFALFARLVRRRRRDGRHYEFRHPLPGAYGGGSSESRVSASIDDRTGVVSHDPPAHRAGRTQRAGRAEGIDGA